MATLGLTSYRFSVSWPRITPDGCLAVKPGGLAFYSTLVDTLLDAGIKPPSRSTTGTSPRPCPRWVAGPSATPRIGLRSTPRSPMVR